MRTAISSVLVCFVCTSMGVRLLGAEEKVHEEKTYRNHRGRISAIAVSPSGNILLTADTTGVLLKWSAKENKRVLELSPYPSEITGMVVTQDDRVAITAHMDTHLRYWDLATGKIRRVVKAHDEPVMMLAIHPIHNELASGSISGALKIWDATTGALRADLRTTGQGIFSGQFTNDGRCLLTGERDGTISVWNHNTRNAPKRIQGHGSRVTSLAVSKDGFKCVSGSQDGTIRIWDCKNWNQLAAFSPRNGMVRSVAFISDGRSIVFTTTLNGSFIPTISALYTYSLDDNCIRQQLPKYTFENSVVATLPESTRFYVGGESAVLYSCRLQRLSH